MKTLIIFGVMLIPGIFAIVMKKDTPIEAKHKSVPTVEAVKKEKNAEQASFLDKYCISCHGPKKQKGKVRLDGEIRPEILHDMFDQVFSRRYAAGRRDTALCSGT